jgi:hypothetical protein
VPHEVVAEVVRSGMVESRHHGSVVALGPDGTVVLAVGETDTAMYPRSANKPAQAAAMLRCGLPLDGELLALAAASHSGEDFHIMGARRILAAADLDEGLLQNVPGWPLDEIAMLAYARRGLEKSSIARDAGTPASGRDSRHDRGTGRRTCRSSGRRRVRSPAVRHDAHRARADLPRTRTGTAGLGGTTDRRGDQGSPPVDQRDASR